MWRGFGLNWNFARAGTCIEEQGMPKYGHHLWLLSPWVKLQPLKYHLEVVKGGWCTSRRHHFPLEGIQTDETPSPFLPSMTIFVSFCYPENLYDWRIFVLVAGPQVVFLCRCLRIRSSDFVVVNAIYVCCIFCYEKLLKTFTKQWEMDIVVMQYTSLLQICYIWDCSCEKEKHTWNINMLW